MPKRFDYEVALDGKTVESVSPGEEFMNYVEKATGENRISWRRAKVNGDEFVGFLMLVGSSIKFTLSHPSYSSKIGWSTWSPLTATPSLSVFQTNYPAFTIKASERLYHLVSDFVKVEEEKAFNHAQGILRRIQNGQ